MTHSRGLPALERAQDLSFLLLALVLPWTIAPMGIATGLCAALALAGLAFGAGRWARTPVDVPAIGWALALTLAALFAVDRSGSLPRLSKALFPALVGLAAAHAARETLGRRALFVLLISAGLAAMLGLGVFLAHGASFAARARGPVGHYMTFAGQLLMFLSVAIAIALAARERRWRIAALLAALPLALALAATFTRSAWLGLVAAVATMLAVLRPRLLPVLAIALALVVVLAPAPIRTRLTGMFDPANAYNRERTFMWDAGVRMYRDHPVTGVGLMDLHPIYDRYRDPASAERAGHLHSVPIHLAATTGTVGLVAFALLFGALLWCAARGLRSQLARGGLGGALRLGVTGALVGFLVSGLFEWNLGDEELLYPLYALAGFAWGARGWDQPGRGAPSMTPATLGPPRVALIHDWLTGMRGGERVFERLCELFPGAPVSTLVWKRGSVSRAIESHPIRTSFLQRLPGAERRYRWFLPLFPRAIESLDFRGFDVLVSTSHAVARAAIAPPGAFHLSYIHTPMRYIWELESQYFPDGRFPWPLSAYVRATCARLRRWDVATSGRPNALIANSAHVAARIRRHYGREAEVVHPPVDVHRYVPHGAPGDYYLLVGAMAPYKRGELAIAACAELGRKLVVAGTGPMAGGLRRQAGEGVEFREGWLDDEQMAALYAGARAVLYPGEEDFGIIPVEAMASGRPVIAYGVGGALETVGRGASAEALAEVARGGIARAPGGVLWGTQTAGALAAAIRVFEGERFDPQELAALAQPFATETFDRRFMEVFERELETFRGRAGAG